MEPSKINHFSLSSWINGTTAQWQKEAETQREIRHLIETHSPPPEETTFSSTESDSPASDDEIEFADDRAVVEQISQTYNKHLAKYGNDRTLMQTENSEWKFVATQLKGEVGSRIVNLLLLPAEVIDTIYHLAMSILTPFLAIGEEFVNWFKNPENQTDYFTLMGATDHLENSFIHAGSTLIRFGAGVLSPEWADKFTTKEVRQIRQADEAREAIRTNLIEGAVEEDQIDELVEAALFALDVEGLTSTRKDLLASKQDFKDKLDNLIELNGGVKKSTAAESILNEKMNKGDGLDDDDLTKKINITVLTAIPQSSEVILRQKNNSKKISELKEELVKVECKLIEIESLLKKAKEIESKKPEFSALAKKALELARAQNTPDQGQVIEIRHDSTDPDDQNDDLVRDATGAIIVPVLSDSDSQEYSDSMKVD